MAVEEKTLKPQPPRKERKTNLLKVVVKSLRMKLIDTRTLAGSIKSARLASSEKGISLIKILTLVIVNVRLYVKPDTLEQIEEELYRLEKKILY